MFAPLLAKPKPKSVEPQHATVAARRPSQTAVNQLQILQRSIGNQAMTRFLAQRANLTGNELAAHENEEARATGRETVPSWDFSNIPIFFFGRERPHIPPLFPAPCLPGPIQAKLKVGAVDDPLEHEADRIADQVMGMPAPTSAPPQVSRKCDACEEEAEKLQKTRRAASHRRGASHRP